MNESTTARTRWEVPADDSELRLVHGDNVVAIITRWSDNKTGSHAWWAIEKADGTLIAIVESLGQACFDACDAVGVDQVDPPADLAAEWSEAGDGVDGLKRSLERRGRTVKVTKPSFTNLDLAVRLSGIMRFVSDWQNSTMMPTEFLGSPPPNGAVARFLDDIRSRLDRLEEAATGKADG